MKVTEARLELPCAYLTRDEGEELLHISLYMTTCQPTAGIKISLTS